MKFFKIWAKETMKLWFTFALLMTFLLIGTELGSLAKFGYQQMRKTVIELLKDSPKQGVPNAERIDKTKVS